MYFDRIRFFCDNFVIFKRIKISRKKLYEIGISFMFCFVVSFKIYVLEVFYFVFGFNVELSDM